MSRNYTAAQKAEIQKRLTELVRTHGRMTSGELAPTRQTTQIIFRRKICGNCI